MHQERRLKSPPPRPMRSAARHLLWLAIVLGVVGCDRVTKRAAGDVLSGAPARSYLYDTVRLTYAENAGAFLSLGADLADPARVALLVGLPGAALVLLIVYGIRGRLSGARLYGLALFVAGGASNWVDRMADGKVVDFLNVGIGAIRTGIFNVADMALLAGVAVFLYGEHRQSRKRRRDGPRAP